MHMIQCSDWSNEEFLEKVNDLKQQLIIEYML